MTKLLLTLLPLAVVTATLCGPGDARAVMAENLLLEQQLILSRNSRGASRALVLGLAPDPGDQRLRPPTEVVSHARVQRAEQGLAGVMTGCSWLDYERLRVSVEEVSRRPTV